MSNRYLRNKTYGDGKKTFYLTPLNFRHTTYIFKIDSSLDSENFQYDEKFIEWLECEVMRDIEDLKRSHTVFDCGYKYNIE